MCAQPTLPVSSWGVGEVAAWLRMDAALEKYATCFNDAEVDGVTLLKLHNSPGLEKLLPHRLVRKRFNRRLLRLIAAVVQRSPRSAAGSNGVQAGGKQRAVSNGSAASAGGCADKQQQKMTPQQRWKKTAAKGGGPGYKLTIQLDAQLSSPRDGGLLSPRPHSPALAAANIRDAANIRERARMKDHQAPAAAQNNPPRKAKVGPEAQASSQQQQQQPQLQPRRPSALTLNAPTLQMTVSPKYAPSSARRRGGSGQASSSTRSNWLI